jgi:hypothetical protein
MAIFHQFGLSLFNSTTSSPFEKPNPSIDNFCDAEAIVKFNDVYFAAFNQPSQSVAAVTVAAHGLLSHFKE